MASQLVTRGVVQGFVPGQKDWVIVSNGVHQVYAYISGVSTRVKQGQTYQVYKQDNTYYLGNQVASQ